MMDWKFDQVPQPFGSFHFICMLIAAIIFVVTFKLTKKGSDKKDSIVVLIMCLFLLSIETWKQLTYLKMNNGVYPFVIFPFQLCSIQQYLGVVAFFIRNKKVKEAIYKYIAFTGILGGIAMLTVPIVIFNISIVMTIHSLIWHTVIVIMGIYLCKTRGYGKNILKEVLPTIPIITIVVAIAIILNNLNMGFNLISLSPVFKNDPPILDKIYQWLDCYPLYALVVYLGLIAGLVLIDLTVMLFRKVGNKLGDKYES